MADGDHINLKPHFKEEGQTLPCEGSVGDLFVFTPLSEGDRDNSRDGLASLWFCVKGNGDERPAIWARVQFDGIASCDVIPPTPPQNHQHLREG